jgi:hypothetical protein
MHIHLTFHIRPLWIPLTFLKLQNSHQFSNFIVGSELGEPPVNMDVLCLQYSNYEDSYDPNDVPADQAAPLTAYQV